MGRSPCCSDAKVNKGSWLPEENERLFEYVQKNGTGNWQTLAKKAGLNRCGKSCRLRWSNYLRPDIKRGPFSKEEEATIISLHKKFGNKWSKIAACLPGRTDNAIKNYWNTRLKKKQEISSGIDPNYQPIYDLNLLSDQMLSKSNLNLVTPLNPTFRYHGNATEMMTNIPFLQGLQNLLQAMSSSVPYLQAISQVHGLINGTNTQYIGGNFFQPQNILADLNSLTPLLNEHLPSTSNSLQGELDVAQKAPGYNTISFNNINNSEYSLPSLVSVIPDASTVNPLESCDGCYIPTQAFESDIFDTWDDFINDEANSTFLKDTLE